MASCCVSRVSTCRPQPRRDQPQQLFGRQQRVTEVAPGKRAGTGEANRPLAVGLGSPGWPSAGERCRASAACHAGLLGCCWSQPVAACTGDRCHFHCCAAVAVAPPGGPPQTPAAHQIPLIKTQSTAECTGALTPSCRSVTQIFPTGHAFHTHGNQSVNLLPSSQCRRAVSFSRQQLYLCGCATVVLLIAFCTYFSVSLHLEYVQTSGIKLAIPSPGERWWAWQRQACVLAAAGCEEPMPRGRTGGCCAAAAPVPAVVSHGLTGPLLC